MTTLTRICLAAAALVVLALPSTALAHSRDRNHDRIPDRWEKHHHLSLKVNQAKRDQDHDGLKNRGEFKAGLNPRDADSDNDGIEDGDERAGTIASFDGTTLVINLFGGGTVSGVVDGSTEIECDDDSGDHASASRDGADDGPNHDAGDDNGGDDNNANCTAAALSQQGTRVKEAELRSNGVFEKLELGG